MKSLRSALKLFFCVIGLISFSTNGHPQEPVSQAGQTSVPTSQSEPYIHRQDTEFLSFDELRLLSSDPYRAGPLHQKLEKFWKTPIISNEAYVAGQRPSKLIDPRLGPFLRVASWNIEKSIQMEKAIELWKTDPERLIFLLDPTEVEPHSKLHEICVNQLKRLISADVIILQEMDIGVKRSGYINAAEEMAKALRMNYAYAPEQLEIDPVMLGLEKITDDDGQIDQEATDYYAVDPLRYKGVFGSAVLSRYPIKSVEAFQLEYQAYDWYEMEKNKIGFLEQTRRLGTKVVFKNQLTREMKVGGRIFMRVDLDVPELPGGILTIINIHLEIKCQPKERELQMLEILSYIRSIRNPVIVMGDFNAAPGDLSPTSVSRVVKRSLKNPTNWLSLAVTYVTPYGLILNTTRGVSNVTKNFQDPLAKNIPVIAPNNVLGLFREIQNYRFSDGGAFDFRGDKKRSVGRKKGALANANQRGRKGFKTTFQVKRPLGMIGKYRLDWVFVKSFLKNPKDKKSTYRFAPHFGETLEELNASLKTPISDHHPNIVDLPFEEPKIKN